MIITNTETVGGYQVTEVLGLVQGSTTRAKNALSDFVANIKNIVGGEISEYTKLLQESRGQALERMQSEAKALGADAVVNVRFSTSAISQGTSEILAYGTAVKLQKI